MATWLHGVWLDDVWLDGVWLGMGAELEGGPSGWAKPPSYHRILVRRPDVTNFEFAGTGKAEDIDD